jgi:hypothetical protein
MKPKPKYSIDEKVSVAQWTGGMKNGIIADISWIYHKRLDKYVWGYKILFDGKKSPSESFFPEGYLRNFDTRSP